MFEFMIKCDSHQLIVSNLFLVYSKQISIYSVFPKKTIILLITSLFLIFVKKGLVLNVI